MGPGVRVHRLRHATLLAKLLLRAPDAVDGPARPLEHLLAQTVAGRAGAVVGDAVALDAEHVAS